MLKPLNITLEDNKIGLSKSIVTLSDFKVHIFLKLSVYLLYSWVTTQLQLINISYIK
jgi:hypothetical protein